MTITSFTDSDRSDVLSFWAEALPLDAVTENLFESHVLLDENFDAETFLLAKKNGTILGFIIGTYARQMPLGDADPNGNRCWITVLAVHPKENPEEIGGELLSELESRFKKLGKKECFVSGYPPGYFVPGIDRKTYKPLIALLRSHGYVPYHEALSMDAPIVLFEVSDEVKKTERKLNENGIVIRQYQRSDLLRFLDFLERTMPSDWVRVERRNLRKIEEGTFRTDQITVVAKGSEIIGYCQFEGSHFGPFGVSDAFQGKGIGTVLLARTIERMKQQGLHNAWVMWTDDRAAKVYGKFGFKETRRFTMLKKEL
ncbi:MAG: GNAT family N-acetyltransferase [Bacteroidota bacterium]|nr:GNAT family N-acetyltransferase [Bacteroidota bacterium]